MYRRVGHACASIIPVVHREIPPHLLQISGHRGSANSSRRYTTTRGQAWSMFSIPWPPSARKPRSPAILSWCGTACEHLRYPSAAAACRRYPRCVATRYLPPGVDGLGLEARRRRYRRPRTVPGPKQLPIDGPDFAIQHNLGIDILPDTPASRQGHLDRDYNQVHQPVDDLPGPTDQYLAEMFGDASATSMRLLEATAEVMVKTWDQVVKTVIDTSHLDDHDLGRAGLVLGCPDSEGLLAPGWARVDFQGRRAPARRRLCGRSSRSPGGAMVAEPGGGSIRRRQVIKLSMVGGW
jgi:hypothetical protein